MSKYVTEGLTVENIAEILGIMQVLAENEIGGGQGGDMFIDHIQVRSVASNNPENIIGKIGWDEDSNVVFRQRKDPKS